MVLNSLVHMVFHYVDCPSDPLNLLTLPPADQEDVC
jgi:hypothetical protein